MQSINADLDSLLDKALQDMQISEEKNSVKESPRKDQLQEMIEEFTKSDNTKANPSELPAKIDSALNKLLEMTNDDSITGMANDADFKEVDEMIEKMMAELTSKELLCEPFQDMAKAYPKWIQKHQSSLDQEKLSSYKSQCDLVCEINNLLQDPSFNDTQEIHQKRIFDLMQQMQELGPPPAEMLEELGMTSSPSRGEQLPPDCIQM